MFAKIYDLPRDDRWQTMARASLRDDLHAVHAPSRAGLGDDGRGRTAAEDRVTAWEKSDEVVVGRAVATLREIMSDEHADLARLSVGLRVVRTMLSRPTVPPPWTTTTIGPDAIR